MRSWLGFAGWNAVAAGAIGFAGQALVAPAAAGAVWAGTLASFAGALAGSVPLAAELDKPSGKAAAAIGKATLLRLAVTVAAGLVAVFSGAAATTERRTLLFSLGASYLALLAVETGWFLKQARKERSTS
jgi:hypothetical protein